MAARVPEGYTVVPRFPDYAVHRSGAVVRLSRAKVPAPAKDVPHFVFVSEGRAGRRRVVAVEDLMREVYDVMEVEDDDGDVRVD